jgi:hypothetical protein
VDVAWGRFVEGAGELQDCQMMWEGFCASSNPIPSWTVRTHEHIEL